jgi:hypothetical protein
MSSHQLLAYAINRGVDILEFCASSAPFITLQEVDAQLQVLDETVTEELNKQLTIQDVDSEFWSVQLMNAIDAATQTAFKDTAHHIGFKSENYRRRLPDYFASLVTCIEAHRADHPLRERVIARLKWILFRPSLAPSIPIMTGFVIVSLQKSWSQVADAIGEVRILTHFGRCLAAHAHMFHRGCAAALVHGCAAAFPHMSHQECAAAFAHMSHQGCAATFAHMSHRGCAAALAHTFHRACVVAFAQMFHRGSAAEH